MAFKKANKLEKRFFYKEFAVRGALGLAIGWIATQAIFGFEKNSSSESDEQVDKTTLEYSVGKKKESRVKYFPGKIRD